MAPWPRILHRGAIRTITDIEPTTTVLNWLRAQGLTGTKEGCAEGDCGACTVVLGSAAETGISYRAVNACILFVATLDGHELITVEDLAEPDGALHPTQQALFRHHGSQCGFCTPGFVMSLFNLHHRPQGTPAGDEDIKDALAGNLCRCTGYRPILAAARDLAAQPPDDRFARTKAERLALLPQITPDSPLRMTSRSGRRFLAPADLSGLSRALADHPGALVLAGGTDVGLWVTKQHRRFDTVIFVGRVASLREIRTDADSLTIGAGVTYEEALPGIARAWPELAEMFRRLGSVQVRNAGTLGGNIANGSPIGDSMPPLIALGAEITLNRGGTRRSLPLEDYYVAYQRTDLQEGEFVENLRIPLRTPEQRVGVYKVSKRLDQDISAVCAGFRLTLAGDIVADFRAGFGGMAAVPARAPALESCLKGRAWSLDTVREAAGTLAQDFSPIGDMRASAAYRRQVAGNLLEKFWIETTMPEVAGGVMPHKTVSHG